MYSNQNTFKELLLHLLSLTKRATLLRFIQPTLLKRKLVFKNAAFIRCRMEGYALCVVDFNFTELAWVGCDERLGDEREANLQS